MNTTTIRTMRRLERMPMERAENGLRFWCTFLAANAACVAIVWLLLHA
ncbi:MAG: hypothetical protein HY342_04285 [Candidatus Lambdaproteobacteria bacterium]|nr:hypothetical protein [Candidatus Lambdaproteobacteria bacterium]